jgi:hypothetical protein
VAAVADRAAAVIEIKSSLSPGVELYLFVLFYLPCFRLTVWRVNRRFSSFRKTAGFLKQPSCCAATAAERRGA